MKQALFAVAMVAPLSSTAAAPAYGGLDYETYIAVTERAAAIFKELLRSESRSWRVEVLLRECGYPVPEGLRMPNEQLWKLIIDRATTAEDLDLTMNVLLALQAWIAGYKVGAEAIVSGEIPSETTCRDARETAQDISALR